MAFIVAGAPLITPTDLAVYLHKSGFDVKVQVSAERSCEFAASQVREVVGFDLMGDAFQVEAEDVSLAKGIAVRIAAQHLSNPEQRQSYAGPEGLSYTGSPMIVGRIMTEADRKTLLGIANRYDPGFG